MIRSENAGSAKLSGGVIVAAGGTPDTLLALAPGTVHTGVAVSVPTGRAGTLALKYGPGTVPHTAKVRVSDTANPFPRTVNVTVTGPGTYAVDHRVNRVFSLSTSADPRGSLEVLLRWKAVQASEGSYGILGVLDVSHPDAEPGQALHIKTTERAQVLGGDDGAIGYGALLVPDKNGYPRPKKPEDEGEICGTFEGRAGDPSKNDFLIRCDPRPV